MPMKEHTFRKPNSIYPVKESEIKDILESFNSFSGCPFFRAVIHEARGKRDKVLQSVESVRGFSSKRGMVGGFRGRWRATAEQRRKKGDFRRIEGGLLIH